MYYLKGAASPNMTKDSWSKNNLQNMQKPYQPSLLLQFICFGSVKFCLIFFVPNILSLFFRVKHFFKLVSFRNIGLTFLGPDENKKVSFESLVLSKLAP